MAKMEPTKFLWTTGLLLALAFEATYGIECFACSSSDITCRRDGINENRAPKRSGCEFCTIVYATEPANYVLRSCRRDAGGYTKDECKESVVSPGEKRCFCKTDRCNGADMDRHVRELQSGGGSDNTGSGGSDNTGTTRPTGSAVTWKMSGHFVVWLMLVKSIFIV